MGTIFRQIFRQSLPYSSTLHVKNIRLWSPAGGSSDETQKYTKDVLKKLVTSNKVVVFMKGNPSAPLCGFSNAVVQILRMHGVQYDAHDVLQSEELRQNIKDFTEWPTIPQVFINGEFVGGCDILLQMHHNGDLIKELKKAGIESAVKDAEPSKEKKDIKK
uniref:Glutaredoxin-related protein 5, mitochondrial n=1 Tax=Glossina brevipalpis TaxID=37001 RepID=A0A1A9WF14_9MUSC